MSYSLVHRFKDGVAELASGDAVDENFDQAKEHIEALETKMAAVEAAFGAALSSQKFQEGVATVLTGALGTGVSTQQIAITPWSTAHVAFLASIAGATNNSSILMRASGVTDLSHGFVVPDMGGTTQSLIINWISIGH